MADKPRSVAEVARLVVRLAGTFKVACGAIIQLCVPNGVRPGFLTLVRDEVRALGCRVTNSDGAYDKLAAEGQARPRKEAEAELATLLTAQTAPPAVAPSSPAAVPAAPSRPTLTLHQQEVLTALCSVGVSSMRTSAAVTVLTGSSPTDGIEQRRIICSSAQEAYLCIVALARAGAIRYNVHAECLEDVPVAVAPPPSASSREALTSPPTVSDRRGYGHKKGANFAGVEGMTERTGRIFLDLLEFAKEDGGELLPPIAQRLFRRLVERKASYRPVSEKSVYMMVSHFLEEELIKRVGRGATGSRYEVTAKGREIASRIQDLLRKQTVPSPAEESAK